VTQSLGGEKNFIVHSLFYIFIIIIIIIINITIFSSSSSSISFIAFLYCLYLNPWFLPFAHFSSPFHWGRRGGVSEWLSSAQLPAARLNHNNTLIGMGWSEILTPSNVLKGG